MFHKTTLRGIESGIEGNGSSSRGRGSPQAVFGNASDVVHDISELAELQARLLSADLKAAIRQAIFPVVLMIVGICVLLGLVPIALLGIANVLAHSVDLSRSVSLFAAAGFGAGLAAVLLAVGWSQFPSGLRELNNSREELKRNIAWVKQTLKNGGSAAGKGQSPITSKGEK